MLKLKINQTKCMLKVNSHKMKITGNFGELGYMS